MITDWLSRLIFLENNRSMQNYYICFTKKSLISHNQYILLKKCTYIQAKSYALRRFFTNFESIYLEKEIEFIINKTCYEEITFNQEYLIYFV